MSAALFETKPTSSLPPIMQSAAEQLKDGLAASIFDFHNLVTARTGRIGRHALFDDAAINVHLEQQLAAIGFTVHRMPDLYMKSPCGQHMILAISTDSATGSEGLRRDDPRYNTIGRSSRKYRDYGVKDWLGILASAQCIQRAQLNLFAPVTDVPVTWPDANPDWSPNIWGLCVHVITDISKEANIAKAVTAELVPISPTREGAVFDQFGRITLIPRYAASPNESRTQRPAKSGQNTQNALDKNDANIDTKIDEIDSIQDLE